MKCRKCGKEVVLPFGCPYCGGSFCSEHRLPENHECPRIELARAPKKESRPAIRQGHEPYQYSVTRTSRRTSGVFHFSRKEIKHLIVGTLLVLGVGISFSAFSSFPVGVLLGLAVTFTFSFLIHEIAHKVSAQHYGLRAEFRLTLFGSILTLMSIVLPFKIISPGAVMMAGAISREEAGKTALAGPLTNVTLSIIFLLLTVGIQGIIPRWGATINAFIALFNLIPFGIMDGWKVFQWNKTAWASTFISSLILTVISFSFLL